MIVLVVDTSKAVRLRVTRTKTTELVDVDDVTTRSWLALLHPAQPHSASRCTVPDGAPHRYTVHGIPGRSRARASRGCTSEPRQQLLSRQGTSYKLQYFHINTLRHYHSLSGLSPLSLTHISHTKPERNDLTFLVAPTAFMTQCMNSQPVTAVHDMPVSYHTSWPEPSGSAARNWFRCCRRPSATVSTRRTTLNDPW